MLWNIYMIFAEKSRPVFSELFCSPFGFRNSSYVNNLNGRHFWTFQTSWNEISTHFCRKKPAGIFGTFLFSIRISQQLLCQQYLIPALIDCLNFKKRNIYAIFAEKSRPAFSELFNSPFWFCLHSYAFKSSTGIFGPKNNYVMKYLHDFCRKKPAGFFGTFQFSILFLLALIWF